MSQQKFMVLRTNDVRRHLSEDQKAQLLEIFKTIRERRTAERQPEESRCLFVLSMRDQYAQPAIEAYIEAIQRDASAYNHEGSQAALLAAQEAREHGLMAGQQKQPSV
jgi:hypothetical protein